MSRSACHTFDAACADAEHDALALRGARPRSGPSAADEAGRSAGPERPVPWTRPDGVRLVDRGLDRLVEAQPAVLDAVDAVVGQCRVTVLVDRVGPEHRLAV